MRWSENADMAYLSKYRRIQTEFLISQLQAVQRSHLVSKLTTWQFPLLSRLICAPASFAFQWTNLPISSLGRCTDDLLQLAPFEASRKLLLVAQRKCLFPATASSWEPYSVTTLPLTKCSEYFVSGFFLCKPCYLSSSHWGRHSSGSTHNPRHLRP